MLFAPECAQRPLQAGEIVWGSVPLPVVDKYKYLFGIRLHVAGPCGACGGQGHHSQLCHGQRAAQSYYDGTYDGTYDETY